MLICTVQDERFERVGVRDRGIELAVRQGVGLLVVNGCCPQDWMMVVELKERYKNMVDIIPQFGVHPWWLDTVEQEGDDGVERAAGWVGTLERMLERYPGAGVGECGLDKMCLRTPQGHASSMTGCGGPGEGVSSIHNAAVAASAMSAASHSHSDGTTKYRTMDVPRSFDTQLKVFEMHIDIAERMKRPITVHCVRAYGALLEVLQARRPCVPVVLHGWMGSKDVTAALVSIENVYFSINVSVLRLKSSAAVDMLRVIPQERLLLESDCPDGLPSRMPLDSWCTLFPEDEEFFRHMQQGTGYTVDGLNTPASVVYAACVVSLAWSGDCSLMSHVLQSTSMTARSIFIDFVASNA